MKRAVLALACGLVFAGPASARMAPAPVSAAASADPVARLAPQVAEMFENYAREQHMPGLVYGVVANGRLVMVKGVGAQDRGAMRPVTADSLFRIASMSKAFTALAIFDLRDRGLLSLDALAESYVPEMRNWKYPTSDSPRIRVRDLLHHVAGFVEDNPWGDRQQPLPEAEFTRMLAAGVPFSRVPQTAMEYSNFGYATLGRIVTNVSGKPYADYIGERILKPLGMTSTGYEVAASPPERRALGYRWENGAWTREPDMAHGAFGAMGGLETSASDYARYVAWLLSAWPARDGPETGPMKRATVRELVQGSNFVQGAARRAAIGPACAQASAYAMGFSVITDCDLGSYMSHTGGYPGYGSVVMLAPEAGVGVFAFSNRTYGAPVPPAYATLKLLKLAGMLAPRPVPVSDRLRAAYAIAADVWRAGEVNAFRDRLANNFLLDRSAAQWGADLSRLKAQVGACRADAPIAATSAMEGRFEWACVKGRIVGRVQLAPTVTPTVQALQFAAMPGGAR